MRSEYKDKYAVAKYYESHQYISPKTFGHIIPFVEPKPESQSENRKNNERCTLEQRILAGKRY